MKQKKKNKGSGCGGVCESEEEERKWVWRQEAYVKRRSGCGGDGNLIYIIY